MPFYDLTCENGHVQIDVMEPVNRPMTMCPQCGAETQRVWLSKPANIVGDEIPGGYWVKHGICNEDGTPRKYYSKSEMRREAERRGLVNRVEHVGTRDGDKSKHTTRWT